MIKKRKEKHSCGGFMVKVIGTVFNTLVLEYDKPIWKCEKCGEEYPFVEDEMLTS